ncbi:MAG TPA: hypothetical protein VHK28_11120, partial [Candidatus Limnocylindria bacterium]|nr:hypothetical protein [Candidatus Limnocylindria bacterium]
MRQPATGGTVSGRDRARRLVAILLAALLLQPVANADVASAAPGDAAAAAAWLAAHRGGAASDWQLVYERPAVSPVDGSPIWAGKLVGPAGELATIYRSADGTIGGWDLLEAKAEGAAAALSTLEVKADDALAGAV